MNRYNFFWAQMISIPFLILFATFEYATAISDPQKIYVGKITPHIVTTIDGWLSAWSSKDITTYGTYYAQDFRSQTGMDRRSWLRYKNGLNRKYNYIRVTRNKLVIKRQSKWAIASFVQTYKSDKYKEVGIKKLLLKQEDGRWKIYRETWKKV